MAFRLHAQVAPHWNRSPPDPDPLVFGAVYFVVVLFATMLSMSGGNFVLIQRLRQ